MNTAYFRLEGMTKGATTSETLTAHEELAATLAQTGRAVEEDDNHHHANAATLFPPHSRNGQRGVTGKKLISCDYAQLVEKLT